MGSIFRSLPLVALLGSAPLAFAQQAQDNTPGFSLPPTGQAPAPDANRQGPELNVYRDPVTPRATPPVVAPTITPPPTTTQPVPQTAPEQPAAQSEPSPQPTRRERPRAATPETQPEATQPQDNAPAPQPAAPAPAPALAKNNEFAPAPSPTPTPAADSASGLPLPWIIGAGAFLAAVAAFVLLRHRRAAALEPVAEVRPAVKPVPPPSPTPVAEPEPAPAPPPLPTAPADDGDRPWLDMDLAITQARFSLMGVTISYALALHNRGTTAARDVIVRGTLGNAGALQQAVLNAFFAGDDGLPLHSVVAVAPGETHRLVGDLRLSADQIAPVEMSGRSLLIPLAAFDASYRWGDDDAAQHGPGRTARAFIVGQEQEPPADRLAPLRLDQGPRQYRRPAARAAAELTPA